ncbi:GCN5-related N-acetyltransferase 4, chloroplastic-like isoform X2 [Phragmites australis]|uniref:GCN5-related N-acetyltransferase 4, chloroplastic-like isoform X2 n=1 Tax=Phragmites australis TaxID=29695 RepID=UPI002D79B1D3|nr:GCN5-related N-acetyltransferase 4, chloroplastic-like isoform X2 [Phragmites australis]
MIPLALSLSRSPASSVFSLPLDGACRSAAAVRRHGPSFAYKPAAGICYASQAVELFPSLYPEIVVRDARLEDCWEVADTHCGSFFPDYKFPLDLVLRIDRYIALLSGFSVPPGCMRTCLVAVNSNSVNNSFSKCGDPRDARFQKYNLSRGSIAGILTVDTVADYLPRRGPLKQRRTGIAYIANVAVRKEERRKGIAKMLVQEAEARARSWGCRSIALHCDANNLAALRLYINQGFKCIRVPEGAKWPEPKIAKGVQYNFMMKLVPKI